MFAFAVDMKASLTMLGAMIFNFSLGVNIHSGLIFLNRLFFTKDISLEFDMAGEH